MRVVVSVPPSYVRRDPGTFYGCQGEVVQVLTKNGQQWYQVKLDRAPENDDRQGWFPLTLEFLVSELQQVV